MSDDKELKKTAKKFEQETMNEEQHRLELKEGYEQDEAYNESED